MGQLDQKIAVITGACSGIGRAALELFVAEGASVLAADIQDESGAQLEAQYQGRVRYRRCDVMREEDIAGAMDFAAATFGGLDIAFNNAGAGGSPNTIEDMTGDAWDYSQHLLLRAPALGMRYAAPHMKARGGGAIVNTASIAGLQAGHASIAYSVAKAGVIHLTKVGAAQLAQHNIRVNAICPGFIMTNIFTPAARINPAMAAAVKKEMRENSPNSQPIHKAGEPEDIARAALYLVSDASAFVTGTHLLVDGGITIGPRHSWDAEVQAERARARDERNARAQAAAKN